jgi:glycolate oxidase FAD binding subunit
MVELHPRDEQDVVELVASAAAERKPIELSGFSTKRQLGRPCVAESVLRTDKLSGIRHYEPSEMVITAGAGTPLMDIVDLIGKEGQRLAFEPFDYPRLFGERGGGSIGGVIAINASGPRRISSGAARDHLLGFRAINGYAKVFKSGGRVMKNVTGYDLSKLVSGSYGTLAVLTEVTLKVVPTPEIEETLILVGLAETAGLSVLRAVSQLQHEVSSMAYFPYRAMPGSRESSLTALRLEGSSVSVRSRRDALLSELRNRAPNVTVLRETESYEFWREAGSGAALRDQKGPLWRISTAPSKACPLLLELTKRKVSHERHYFDWAGGLLWLALDEGSGSCANTIREIVDSLGGHATLVRASREKRLTVPVFHPRPQALSAIYREIKNAFDPAHVLNRGRVSPEY